MNNYKNIKSQIYPINNVVTICLISLWISLIIVFNEYLQAKFAVKILIIHSAGIMVITKLLNILSRFKIKSLFWKVESVIFAYFILYFLMSKAYVFFKYNQIFLRGYRTDVAELMTFSMTIFFSIIITMLFNYLSKKSLKKSIYSVETPKELGKNKWLYPADEFVEKWKKPKRYKSKNFEL